MTPTRVRLLKQECQDINLAKFNIGNVAKAISEDLEEFGDKGVQGLPVKTADALKLAKKENVTKLARDPYSP